MLRRDAPAKINLSLEVIGRRPDGFHALRSVMQTISVFDTLDFERSPRDELTVSDPTLATPDNLVLRAIRTLRALSGGGGVAVQLSKEIPSAAGLGGGSSDAAATLLALNDLWESRVPPSALCAAAAELGSDVPFFLNGGTALVEGRGEIVEPLPAPPPVWYLLVKPPAGVSTARVFAELQPGEWSDGQQTQDLVRAIRAGEDVRFGPNDLQAALFRVSGAARRCYDLVASLAPDCLVVSGSGPTVVGLYRSQQSARDAAQGVPPGYWTRVAMPYDRREE